MIHHNTTNRGLALLMTLLTVSVIITVTVSLVELSRLQLRLAVDSRDAEVAFSAANAGMECAQRVRLVASSTFALQNQNITGITCFNQNLQLNRTQQQSNIQLYSGEITWGVVNRCTELRMLTLFSGDTPISFNVSTLFPNVAPSQQTVSCPSFSECTVVSATGYSASCANKNQSGVLKRDVLLQF